MRNDRNERQHLKQVLAAVALGVLTAVGVGCPSSASVAAHPRTSHQPSLSGTDVALAAALLEAADTRRVDTLAIDSGLASSASFVRSLAARTAGQNGITSRTPVLRALLADGDTAVAADAAFALGLLRDTAGVPQLARALERTPAVAEAAAWSLGELGGAARPAIERSLAGEPGVALAPVLQASAKLRPVPASLIVPFLEHRDRDVRRAAAYAVTRSRVPAAVRALLAVDVASRVRADSMAHDDADADFRSYVARGLGRPVVGDSLSADAAARLRRLLDDPHAHVRVNAARSLATYGVAAREALLARVVDPDANVRVAIAQSLGDVLGPVAADWGDAWAADTGFTYRRSVLASSIRAGARLAALDIANRDAWQLHRDWRYRAAAAQAAAAGSIREIDAIAAPLLGDPDPRVRNSAYGAVLPWADSAAAAGKRYGRTALPEALADPDLFVRASILDALRSHARPADASVAFRAWKAAANDPENDARLAALRVIAAAWARDSGAFTRAFRDSLASTPIPADPVERGVGRTAGPLAHWSASGAVARPSSWYRAQIRDFVLPALEGKPTHASIVTQRGTVVVEFFGADAPLTVANFVALARRGYYDGLAFHRVVPNFVAQDGDPRGDGSGGPGYAIRDELNRRWYNRGAVGMALSGPDTGGSQYFLSHSPQPHLDGHYTVFGHVSAGFDVLDAIVQGDRISRVIIR